MRRFALGTLGLVLALTLLAPSASAQFFVGAGATLPSGDYGEYAKTGWLVNAGFSPWRSSNDRAAVWLEGVFGSNSHDDHDGDKTNLYGALGSVAYDVTTQGSAVPYVIGSVGYLVHQYKSDLFPEAEGSEGGLAFGGGAGVGFGKFYVEARYMNVSIDEAATAFILISAGILF